MTKHRSVVAGYDSAHENPDGSTGRPKGVQTASDMRIATTYDVLAEGVFAAQGVPTITGSPTDMATISPFMAAILSPNGGYYVVSIDDDEQFQINLANAGLVKIFVQQRDWEVDNVSQDSEVYIGVVYGANPIPAGALLLFQTTITAQTSTSGLSFSPQFKFTGAASGVIRVPEQSVLGRVAVLEPGIRALALDDSGEWYYGIDNQWYSTNVANPQLDTGWITPVGTWSFLSWSAATRTGVMNAPSNATTKYSPGMRVKFSQATGGQKYCIITAVSATTITAFFPLGTTFTNETITSPFYSLHKAPLGFPLEETLWILQFTAPGTQAMMNVGAVNTWVNPGNYQLAVPVGAWRLRLQGNLTQANTSAGIFAPAAGLATSPTAEPFPEMTQQFVIRPTGTTSHVSPYYSQINRTFASPQTLYLNVKSGGGGGTVTAGWSQPTATGNGYTVEAAAICAYL